MTYPLMSLLLIFSLNIKIGLQKAFAVIYFDDQASFGIKKFPAEGLKRNRQKNTSIFC